MTTAVATRPSLINKFAERYSIEATKLLPILKATAFKVKDAEATDEQMAALLIVADQYGLNPFTKEIFAYPDRGGIVPVVSVDGWSRMINENPAMDGVTFGYSETRVKHKGHECHEWIECAISRKDRANPIVVREYFDEVVRELKYTCPWDTHPNRMHRHKAFIQCARLAFGFAGVYDDDEAQRIIEATAERDITPIATPKPAQKPETARSGGVPLEAPQTSVPAPESAAATQMPDTETNAPHAGSGIVGNERPSQSTAPGPAAPPAEKHLNAQGEGLEPGKGEVANPPAAKRGKASTQAGPAPAPLTDGQTNVIRARMKSNGIKEEAFIETFGVALETGALVSVNAAMAFARGKGRQ